MEYSYAGLWKRSLAGLIDILLSAIFIIPIIICYQNVKMLSALLKADEAILLINYEQLNKEYNIYLLLLFIGFGIILNFNLFYNIILDGPKFKGTLGKKLLGIIVIDTNGNNLTSNLSFIRYVVKYSFIYILLFGFIIFGDSEVYINIIFIAIIILSISIVGLILCAFNKKKQTLYDIILKTFVINKKTRT